MPRPRVTVDRKLVKQLASIGLSIEEIGATLGCSPDTITRRFQKEVHSGWQVMKASVKRAQYDLGVNKRDRVMLIWLGKNYCGQSDEGNRKDAGVGDQLESFFKALMAGPAEASNNNSGTVPAATTDAVAASPGDVTPDRNVTPSSSDESREPGVADVTSPPEESGGRRE